MISEATSMIRGNEHAMAKRVIFDGPRCVRLEQIVVNLEDLGPHEVAVAARWSVLSPGTELAHFRGDALSGVLPHASRHGYPFIPGYAMVGSVIAAGREAGLEVGTAVLSHTPHQSLVRFDRRECVCVALPRGIALDEAPFARLAQVGAASLLVSSARAGDVVAVLGLGPIGNLAAQVAMCAGFVTVGVEKAASRRELARRCGIEQVFTPEEAFAALEAMGGARLVLECTGRAAAVVFAAELCAHYGEVMTVGAPWLRDADVAASALVACIFERYLSLRSGWEWQVPRYDGPRGRSIASCTGWVVDQLLAGKIRPAELVSGRLVPAEVERGYRLLDTDADRNVTFLIDWG